MALCKSCKRKIDEHLCPYCGYNNNGNKAQNKSFNYYDTPNRDEEYDKDYKPDIESEINDEHVSKMNETYKQHTKPAQTNSENVSADNYGNEYVFDKLAQAKIDLMDNDFPSTGFAQKTIVVKSVDGKYIRITKTINNGHVDTKYEDLLLSSKNNDNRTFNFTSSSVSNKGFSGSRTAYSINRASSSPDVNSELVRIIVLAFILMFGFWAYPIVGLVMLFTLKRKCKRFMEQSPDNKNVRLIKTIHSISSVALVVNIIIHVFMFVASFL